MSTRMKRYVAVPIQPYTLIKWGVFDTKEQRIWRPERGPHDSEDFTFYGALFGKRNAKKLARALNAQVQPW